LPDIFSNQKPQFGKIWDSLSMEDVGTLNGNLVYFVAIWYILWQFGTFYG
jgi:hypothetical protein